MLRLYYIILYRMKMKRYQDEENFNFIIKFENERKKTFKISIFVSKWNWKMEKILHQVRWQ